MITTYWEYFKRNLDGTGVWTDMGSNRVAFSSGTNINSAISVASFQAGSHIGSATPGIDECGQTHLPNSKLISFNSFVLTPQIGSSSAIQQISDAHLVGDGSGLNGDFRSCTFRIHIKSDTLVGLQNTKFFSYDGVSQSLPAKDIEAAAWVVGNDMTQWQTINSYAATGLNIAGMQFNVSALGGISSAILIKDQLPATDHYFPVAVSVSPEKAGVKGAVAFGCYSEYY